eukprot:2608245-Ditylum_brightwellii.AAC.1
MLPMEEIWAQHCTFQACFGCKNPDDVLMDEDEVDLCVDLAHLCSHNSRNERKVSAYSLNKMEIICNKRQVKESNRDK